MVDSEPGRPGLGANRAMTGGLGRLLFPERGAGVCQGDCLEIGAQTRSLWGHVLVRPSYGDDLPFREEGKNIPEWSLPIDLGIIHQHPKPL